MIKTLFKKVFKGVTWQHPVLRIVILCINPLDYVRRSFSGLTHLPTYSERVVSNGVTRQFGGKRFAHLGKVLSRQLQENTEVNPTSYVLEIGCGCGRTAIALAGFLGEGNYTGMDIHKGSIKACLDNPSLRKKCFSFDHLDIQNNEYNPNGSLAAHTLVFPYASGSYDVIFLVSVFTHMKTKDVKNYIKEIARMTRPGGICMVTTFLIDPKKGGKRISFPLKEEEHYYYNESLPEEAIGYELGFYLKHFSQQDMTQKGEVVWGSWRGISSIQSTSGFSQDIVLFRKADLTKTGA